MENAYLFRKFQTTFVRKNFSFLVPTCPQSPVPLSASVT